MDKKNFYITTTLPYVNAEPHVGFAMEIIRADILARYKQLQGYTVFFNTGTDEHGLKIFRKSQELNQSPQEYVDGYAARFKDLIPSLHILPSITFIRTTNPSHKYAAQAFWKLCEKNGDIYKKAYKIKYCVGCELEKTESELVDGKCPIHPMLELEIIEEENYFFRFSKYQKPLLELYKKNPHLVTPDFRFNEIKAFVERGLEDFSISRLKNKMPWGVEVPADELHVMYVWFDALVNYISTLGWPDNMETFNLFWQQGITVQICGKDNLRQQSAMWQAMLMSAGLENTQSIIINGFITSNGQKMSKSLGNVINPFDIVKEFGAEALRYYVARELSPFEDSDMTMESFKNAYNANLANGLGNLVSRIMKMAISNNVALTSEELQSTYFDEPRSGYEEFNIKEEADEIWKKITMLDNEIQLKQPFKRIKTDPETAKADIHDLVYHLYQEVALPLEPIMPETAKNIQNLIKENKMPDNPLFLRKE